ncbi:hypothetical protein [Mucilaginibacter celer]|uniref:Uncharacterized protein n=1 Tax=Mucilaginibacter celer TaxID=2305508 RepID=A0A494VLV1_9SPHI|nr:hypothetical protein [Mucilaginibacter celer]AYL96247.1 hypothetical protein HYN43_013510 [Mucilaginibacter celer]
MKKIFYLLVIALLLASVSLITSCHRDHHLPHPGHGDTTVTTPCTQGFPTLVWVKPLTDSTANTGEAADITVGSDKNLLISGFFNGTGDFNPGTAVLNLTAPSANAPYQQHFDVTGKFLTANVVSTAGIPPLPAGSVKRLRDAAGNYYTFGSFAGTYDFDPGAGVFTLTYNGPADEVGGAYYIQKLDASGNFKWAVLTGIILTADYTSNAFDIDANGAVYAGGYMPVEEPDAGQGIVKFDSNGALVWRKGTETANDMDLLTDSKKNVYTVSYNYLSGQPHALVKYDSNGNQVSKTNLALGGTLLTANLKLQADAFDNIYVGGSISTDFFVEKHDPSNQIVWTIRSHGVLNPGENPLRSRNELTSLAIDAAGENIYLIGIYYGTVNFNPGSGSNTLTMPFPEGRYFIARYAQCH